MRKTAGGLPALASAIYVAALIAFALRYLWGTFWIPWFASSDEYVVVFEVIRFVQRDFRQHFFDMPGTPLMALASILWALYYYAGCALRVFSFDRGIAVFTFERLPDLFVLLRGLTLFFFCLSLVLLYRLAARLMNRPAAWVATFVLAMSQLYAAMSSFVRVESLSMCFMLSGLLVLVRALDEAPDGTAAGCRRWDALDPMLVAGALIGLGAATRLHAITASLPAAAMLLAFAPRKLRQVDYPRSVKIAAFLAGVVLGLAGVLTIVWRSAFEPFWTAYHGIQTAIVGGLCGLAAGALAYRIPRTRPLLIRIISPDLVRLLIGIGGGFLAGTPTIIWQYRFFLQSVNFYSTSYRDIERIAWPFSQNVQWYVRYYFAYITPDRVLLVLLVAGAFFIALRRDRRLAPFLIAAILFFVSKPLTLIAAPHHVVLWLPFYALVCAYPVAALVDFGERRGREGQSVAYFGVAAVFASLVVWITPGPAMIRRDPGNAERLANVQQASDWIIDHTEPDATVAVAFYCFNPGTFFVWLRSQEVPVPGNYAPDRRTYVVWWDQIEALQTHAGYACMTNTDLELSARLDKARPGQGALPLSDPRFEWVQSFGSGPNRVNLFRFDFRSDATSRVLGEPARNGPAIRVVGGTYGGNCRATRGNSTISVAAECNGRTTCEYAVHVGTLGDPALGCVKDFVAEWTCGSSNTVHRAEAVPTGSEAGLGSIVTLSCPVPGDSQARRPSSSDTAELR